MAFMEWSDALVLGIAEIDNQHHWLVDATNALHDEINNGHADREKMARLLEGLVDYTLIHFVTEELLFQAHAYPEEEAHHLEHQAFVSMVRQWQLRYAEGEELGSEILAFLKRWLVQHILISDKAYVPHLKACGVK